MTIRGSFHVRSERLDPLSQTDFSMASTCVWRCIASPLFPSRKEFFTHTHTLERLRVHSGEFARSIHVCIHERDIPYRTAQKLPTEGERENERKGVTKSGELSKLSRLSPRLSFRSWLKQPQRFSSGKTRCERWNKTWSGFRREFDDWQCAANVDNERRALWKMYIAKWFSRTNDNIQGDQWLGTIVRQTSHINWGIFTYKRIHTECFKTFERHFNNIDSLINLNNHWQQ